ncbi:MAG: RNA polymerase sigma factor [Fimbriimonadaceae bacterium]
MRSNFDKAITNVKDLETASKIANGNAEAMEAFVQEHYASVLRFMRHLTRNLDDAEDLTQQAFINAKRKANSFRGHSSLKTWLHRIAFYEYTHWKRVQRRTERLSLHHAVREPGFETCLEAASLLDALATLSNRHRETFLLHEVQELSVQEVAKVMGTPVGTVKSRLNKARRLLRIELERENEETLIGKTVYESH